MDAATERRLPVSGSLARLMAGRLAEVLSSVGTLRGGVGKVSSDGVDELVTEDVERRSGVEIAGLCIGRAEICGVEMGVGVLL